MLGGNKMKKKEITEVLAQGQKQIQKGDISDITVFSNKYFKCGFEKEREFNYAYGAGLSIIGRVYNHKGISVDKYGDKNKSNRNSDYHNGVAYLAKEAKVTASEVKAIRKTFKARAGYCYRLPYNFDKIVGKMIELLSELDNKIKKVYFKNYNGVTYRQVLVQNQCAAINYGVKEAKSNNVSSEKVDKIVQIKNNVDGMASKIEW